MQIQGTLIGIGERCGNTNLATVIAGLQLKRGMHCVPEENISDLTRLARYIAEVSNMKLSGNMPYVGKSAFSHKGGMHADGVMKNPKSFEHTPPESVGNKRNILLSGGRTLSYSSRINQIAPELTKAAPKPRAYRPTQGHGIQGLPV